MKATYLIFLICICFNVIAQKKHLEIKITSTTNELKLINFHIDQISFSNEVKDTMGFIGIRKKTLEQKAVLVNKLYDLQTIISSHYTQSLNGTPIHLKIKKLGSYPVNPNYFSPSDTFKYECDFVGIFNGNEELLYTYKAKNLFGSFVNPAEVLSNYISRAFISSIDQFSKTFDSNSQWNILNDTSTTKINIVVFQNSIKGADSIPCSKNTKLQLSDFNIAKNKDSNSAIGHCRMILTYVAYLEESNTKPSLFIHVKSFFNRTRSWINPTLANEEWLSYQQGHFDLCTIYGNKLTNECKQFPFTLGEYKSELNQLYNKVYTEYVLKRKQYETETNQGRNNEMIKKWKSDIDNLMK